MAEIKEELNTVATEHVSALKELFTYELQVALPEEYAHLAKKQAKVSLSIFRDRVLGVFITNLSDVKSVKFNEPAKEYLPSLYKAMDEIKLENRTQVFQRIFDAYEIIRISGALWKG